MSEKRGFPPTYGLTSFRPNANPLPYHEIFSDIKNSFTAKYNLTKLIYHEDCHSIENAIPREKQLKNYCRKKKEELINGVNPKWEDLYPTII